MTTSLIKLGASCLLVVGVVIGTRRRGLRWREDLAVVPPPSTPALGALALWGLWLFLSEHLLTLLGEPAPQVWEGAGPAVWAARFLGIVVAAPLAEELFFRGLLYHLFARTRMGVGGAILLCGALFGLAHFQYEVVGMSQTLVDGVLFGLARWRTRSVLTPMAMHACGNLLAWAQRIPW